MDTFHVGTFSRLLRCPLKTGFAVYLMFYLIVRCLVIKIIINENWLDIDLKVQFCGKNLI